MNRNFRFSILAISCIALAFLLTFNMNQQRVQADEQFDRRAMLTSIVENVIFPAQEAFIDTSAQLEADVATFADDPTLDNLVVVQKSWRQSSNAWEEMINYALDLRLDSFHNQVDKHPLNIEFVEGILNGDDEITENYVEGIGSTSRGLPAIEYLIFDPSLSPDEILATFDDEQRMAFLVALAQNIHNKAEEIHRYWADVDGRNYAKTFIEQDQEGGTIQGSINMIVNEMFLTLEDDLDMWIGEPSGIALGTDPQPDLVESPRSGQSAQHILHHLIGLQKLFNGGEADDMLGFDDYLDFLGAEYDDTTLSEAINARFDIAITAIESLEQPLQIAVIDNPEQVAEIYEAMRQLLIPFRADMNSQLNIVITLSDRDGDQ